MEIYPWGRIEEERIHLDKDMSGMKHRKKTETPGGSWLSPVSPGISVAGWTTCQEGY
jgi:hypothetical protein